jgi:hypothetical protein
VAFRTKHGAYRLVVIDDIGHAYRKLLSKTLCGLRIPAFTAPPGRTTNCPACRIAIGLRPLPDALTQIARQTLKRKRVGP